MKRYLICTLVSLSTAVFAIHPDQAKDTDSLPRIVTLLPNLVSPLGVEPGVPSYFVAMSPSGTLDPCDWIYWGPKDVLEPYFNDPTGLRGPVIRVKLSDNIAQTEPGRFSDETVYAIQRMKGQDPRNFQYHELQWGPYPVMAVKARIGKKIALMAWVGLNDPDSGAALMFNLVYPEQNNAPNNQEEAFWNQFLSSTKLLAEPEYFKAMGQDLQPGYTIVRACGSKLKMTAEKREGDGVVQVVVIPMEKSLSYRCYDIKECQLGSQWKQGAPLVKVHGMICNQKGNWSASSGEVTSILVETVPEFSINGEDEHASSGMWVYQAASNPC